MIYDNLLNETQQQMDQRKQREPPQVTSVKTKRGPHLISASSN